MRLKKPRKDIMTESWIDSTSSLLANESMSLLLSQGDMRGGEEVSAHLLVNYLAKFVGMMVLSSLANPEKIKGMTPKEKYEFTRSNYLNMKSGIEEAIATGFSAGFESFSKKPVDYYCKITTIPEPTSKLAS